MVFRCRVFVWGCVWPRIFDAARIVLRCVFRFSNAWWCMPWVDDRFHWVVQSISSGTERVFPGQGHQIEFP